MDMASPATPRHATYGRPLTKREFQVLVLAARGYTNTEIGEKLHLVEDTIKTHMRRIMFKLGARNRTHAVTIAFCKGLLQLPKDPHGGDQ